MIQVTKQNELVRFLKILQIKVQKYEENFKKFLVQVNQPMLEISPNCTVVEQNQEQEQEPIFTLRP